MKLNKVIADTLDMDIPEDGETKLPSTVSVEPHEIMILENPNLPDMQDIDHRLLEGEKELDLVIKKTLAVADDMYEDAPNIDPRNRNRFMEIAAQFYGQSLDAIKHKTDLQLKKKQTRLKEAGFEGVKDSAAGGNVNNFVFSGDREDFLAAIESMTTDNK